MHSDNSGVYRISIFLTEKHKRIPIYAVFFTFTFNFTFSLNKRYNSVVLFQ